jgi:alpha-tubulin suppressor-like RCC1 family protein
MKKQRWSILPVLLAAALAACNGNPIMITPSITSVQVNASSLNLAAGASQAITATVSGTGGFNPSVTWNIESGGGTLSSITSSSVTFNAPSLSSSSTTVVRATSVQDTSKFDSVTLNIAASPSTSSITGVSITTSKVNVRASESTILTGLVTGTGAFDNSLTWAIKAGGVGSLSSSTGSSVTYLGPSSSLGKVVQITATSVQDPTKQYTIFLGLHPNQPTIAAGGFHAIAIKTDGTLLSWGNNGYGQLGNDPMILFNEFAPVAVVGASDIVAVAAGNAHSLALKADGTMLAWGNDAGGQLGNDATLEDKAAPVAVSGATGIIAISAGYFYSLALKSDGTMLAWGNNSKGQLGDSAILTDKPTPVAVSGASDIVAISAGSEHSLALKADGTMLTWGLDIDGQLGNDAQLVDQSLPVLVANATGIVSIAAGYNHSLALTSSGNVLAWGSDFGGQLGDNIPKVNKSTPVTVNGANQIVAIDGGHFHSLALTSSGTMLAWGSDTYGELGDGNQVNPQGLPVTVENVSNIVSIAAGGQFSLALKSDGTLQSWGQDFSGQLGDGSTPNNCSGCSNSAVSVLLGGFTIRVP